MSTITGHGEDPQNTKGQIHHHHILRRDQTLLPGVTAAVTIAEATHGELVTLHLHQQEAVLLIAVEVQEAPALAVQVHHHLVQVVEAEHVAETDQ